MEFKYLPSFTNDYNFVVCYKKNPSQDKWEYYSVTNTMNEAQSDIKCLRRREYEYLVIINVSRYERGKYHDN